MISRSALSSFVAFFVACRAAVALAEEASNDGLQSDYKNDLYHCADPTDATNVIPCNPVTYRWNLEALDPSVKPDDSVLCGEVVDLLVRAKEKEQVNDGRLQDVQQGQQQNLVKNIQLWETIMSTSVVDQLEPCVLWAMAYGPLAKWASSMGTIDQQHQQVEIQDAEPDADSLDVTIDFDPIVIALVWEEELSEPLSIDRAELHDTTAVHMLEALRAELGAEMVDYLDLVVQAGLPDYETKLLPLTLSGTVGFNNPRQALGPSSLRRVLLQIAFRKVNAIDLYRFRLKIAKDPTLGGVTEVLVGREVVAEYILMGGDVENSDSGSYNYNNGNTDNNNNDKTGAQQIIDTSNMDLSEDDEGFVSILLVGILAAVGAAIVAVMCFTYFLVCRSRTSGRAAKTLEEHSLVEEAEQEESNRKSSNASLRKTGSGRKVSSSSNKNYRDDVPAVQTAPTDMIDENDEYDIEYVAGSNVDDGVSEYDMETLPPPSTHIPEDTDDENSVVMSVMDGYDNENLNPYNYSGDEDEETGAASGTEKSGDNVNSDQNTVSDGASSLYSYIPDDTSLSASLTNGGSSYNMSVNNNSSSGADKPETTMEKAQKKGLLWSVLKVNPNTDSSDTDASEIIFHKAAGAKKNSRKSPTTAMLGPTSDNDSESHDSNSLLYGTDDDEANRAGTSHRFKENPHSYNQEQQEQHQQEAATNEDSSLSVTENDKKNKFEDLWKDENEIEEAESVLNYLTTVQSARRTAAAENIPPPPSSIKIIDTATPVQTPDKSWNVASGQQQPNADQDDVSMLSSMAGQASEKNDAENSEHEQMALPLPASLDDSNLRSLAADDSSSVSSNTSRKNNRTIGSMVGGSVRRKKSSKWMASSSSVVSSESSVCSTDSSKLRSLLGQSDTNDAALVFGKQTAGQQKDDTSTSSGSAGATPDVNTSMSSCTSAQLKSLLTNENNTSRDSAEGDNELLFDKNSGNETTKPRRVSALREEEKKETELEEGDDDDERKLIYLPLAISPREAKSPDSEANDSGSVLSALSEAPSVDESINSGMGWF